MGFQVENQLQISKVSMEDTNSVFVSHSFLVLWLCGTIMPSKKEVKNNICRTTQGLRVMCVSVHVGLCVCLYPSICSFVSIAYKLVPLIMGQICILKEPWSATEKKTLLPPPPFFLVKSNKWLIIV